MTTATLSIGRRVRAAVAFTVLSAGAVIGTVGSARAEAVDSPRVTVGYADLNLSTDQGSRVLYARIVAAARQVCVADDIRDLRAFNAANACREQAIAQAVRDVNSPMLASVHAARLRHG